MRSYCEQCRHRPGLQTVALKIAFFSSLLLFQRSLLAFNRNEHSFFSFFSSKSFFSIAFLIKQTVPVADTNVCRTGIDVWDVWPIGDIHVRIVYACVLVRVSREWDFSDLVLGRDVWIWWSSGPIRQAYMAGRHARCAASLPSLHSSIWMGLVFFLSLFIYMIFYFCSVNSLIFVPSQCSFDIFRSYFTCTLLSVEVI